MGFLRDEFWSSMHILDGFRQSIRFILKNIIRSFVILVSRIFSIVIVVQKYVSFVLLIRIVSKFSAHTVQIEPLMPTEKVTLEIVEFALEKNLSITGLKMLYMYRKHWILLKRRILLELGVVLKWRKLKYKLICVTGVQKSKHDCTNEFMIVILHYKMLQKSDYFKAYCYRINGEFSNSILSRCKLNGYSKIMNKF